MKKKPASQSAFFNSRVLVGFTICAIGAVFALLAFAIYPAGNAFARQNKVKEPSQNIVVPTFQANPPVQSVDPSPDQVSITDLTPSGSVDLAALGVHPVSKPYPLSPQASQSSGGGPDSGVMGKLGAYC